MNDFNRRADTDDAWMRGYALGRADAEKEQAEVKALAHRHAALATLRLVRERDPENFQEFLQNMTNIDHYDYAKELDA